MTFWVHAETIRQLHLIKFLCYAKIGKIRKESCCFFATVQNKLWRRWWNRKGTPMQLEWSLPTDLCNLLSFLLHSRLLDKKKSFQKTNGIESIITDHWKIPVTTKISSLTSVPLWLLALHLMNREWDAVIVKTLTPSPFSRLLSEELDVSSCHWASSALHPMSARRNWKQSVGK